MIQNKLQRKERNKSIKKNLYWLNTARPRYVLLNFKHFGLGECLLTLKLILNC